jgi:hypothetical protein
MVKPASNPSFRAVLSYPGRLWRVKARDGNDALLFGLNDGGIHCLCLRNSYQAKHKVNITATIAVFFYPLTPYFLLYCSSVTFSIHSTFLPLTVPVMAI